MLLRSKRVLDGSKPEPRIPYKKMPPKRLMTTKSIKVLKKSNVAKATIPKALREQVWIKTMGHQFEGKCPVTWCANQINVFNFQSGHCIPESKGGATTIDNLVPICDRCNLSMSNQYTISEWSATFQGKPRTLFQRLCCCFFQSNR
jgi:hypothetical protein